MGGARETRIEIMRNGDGKRGIDVRRGRPKQQGDLDSGCEDAMPGKMRIEVAPKQEVTTLLYTAGKPDLGLDCRKGLRLAPGVGFEAGAAGRVVSSPRKTSRAVITRTIIDGSTVDIRESPGVFYGKLATGLTGRPRTGLC